MEGLKVGAELAHPEVWEVPFKVMSVLMRSGGDFEVDAYCWPPGTKEADYMDYHSQMAQIPAYSKYLAIQTHQIPWINCRYRVHYIVPLYLPGNNFAGSFWHFRNLDTVERPFIVHQLQ